MCISISSICSGKFYRNCKGQGEGDELAEQYMGREELWVIVGTEVKEGMANLKRLFRSKIRIFPPSGLGFSISTDEAKQEHYVVS